MHGSESEIRPGITRRVRRVATASMVGLVVVAAASASGGREADSGGPVVTIHAVRYDFEPAEVTVKRGQTVRLTFVADDVPHGISIDGLGIETDLPRHKPQTVTITPSTVGDFDGECSRYCGAGHREMTFVVHVVP